MEKWGRVEWESEDGCIAVGRNVEVGALGDEGWV